MFLYTLLSARWVIEEFGLALEESGRWLVPEMASSSQVIEFPFLTNHSKNPNITNDYEFAVSDICRMTEVTFLKDVSRVCESLNNGATT